MLSASPQRAQAGTVWTGNSDQQTGQIGTEESAGRGEPQRSQEEGRRAQLKLSIGLRSTRTTARQRVVCARGTSVTRMAVSLEKTHLASGQSRTDAARCGKYSARAETSAQGRSPRMLEAWPGRVGLGVRSKALQKTTRGRKPKEATPCASIGRQPAVFMGQDASDRQREF
jgi:hypothetical protein